MDDVTTSCNSLYAYQDVLLEKGRCLISEYLVWVKSWEENFVVRDRLQVLFSRLVIVVESQEGYMAYSRVC